MADINRNLLVWLPKGDLNTDYHKDAISHSTGDYSLLYDMNLSNNEAGTDGVLNPFVSALKTYDIPPAQNRKSQWLYIRKKKHPDTTLSNAIVRLEFYDINYERYDAYYVNDLSSFLSALTSYGMTILYSSSSDDYEFCILFENTGNYCIVNIADDTVKGSSGLYQHGMIRDACYVARHDFVKIPMSFAGYVPFEDGFFAFYTACNYKYYEVEVSNIQIERDRNDIIKITAYPSIFLDIPTTAFGSQIVHYCEIITEEIAGTPHPERCYFDGVWPMYYDGNQFTFHSGINYGINNNAYYTVTDTTPPGSIIKLRVGHITYGRIYYFKRGSTERTQDGNIVEYYPQLIYDGMGMGFNPYHKCYGNAVRMNDEIILTLHRWRLGPPTQIVFNKTLKREGLQVGVIGPDLEKDNLGYYNLPYFSIHNMRFPSAYESSSPSILSVKKVDSGGKLRVGPKKYYLKYKYRGDAEYRYKIFHDEIIAHNKGPSQTQKTIHGGLSSDYTNMGVEIKINAGAARYKEFHVGCIEKTGPMSFNTNIIFSVTEDSNNIPSKVLHSEYYDIPDTDIELFLERSNVIYDIDSIELCNNRMFFGNFGINNLPPPYLTNKTVKHNIRMEAVMTSLSPHEMLSGLEWHREDAGLSSYNLRGFCINEIYRFGFIGVGHDGTISMPRWLTDIIINTSPFNDPLETGGTGYDDRAAAMPYWYITLGYNDKNYNAFIEFRNILRTFARNRYRDFVLIRDERVGRVAHNSIGLLTQFDAEMTFSSAGVFYLYDKGQSDPVQNIGNTFPTYLTFNRAAFPINYAKDINIQIVNQHQNTLYTGHNGIWTASNLYTGGYVVFATDKITDINHPYSSYFHYFVIDDNAKYVAVGTPHHRYAISTYAKQRFDYGFIEPTILMLFSPEDLLLGPKDINPEEHSLAVFHGNNTFTSSFVTKITCFNENSWFLQGPNDLMGASQYVPLSRVGLIPQIINISFDGLYDSMAIEIKDLNHVKYVSRGQQAIFPKITEPYNSMPRFVYGIEWMPLTGNQNKRKIKAKPLVYNNPYNSTNGAAIATINHYVIDKKEGSFLWASYPATYPKQYEDDSDINMWQGNSPLLEGDMWVPNSKQFVQGFHLLDYYDNPQHLCLQGNDFMDIAKNSHRFYFETESGYVVQVKSNHGFFDSSAPKQAIRSVLQNIYNKTGYIFYCQILKKNAYKEYLQENKNTFKNAIVTNIFEKAFEGDTAHEWTCFCGKGDTYINVITHKVAYPRKDNMYYNQIDEKNSVLGMSFRYVIPSFVNYAARNVKFSKETDGISSSFYEEPSWPQNQHTIKEYLPNYNRDAYNIDPMYANEIMPMIVRADGYDPKRNKKERFPTLVVFSNPIVTRNDYASALKIIPQNIRNLPYSGGEITNMINYGAYLLVMQKNSISQYIKAHSNVVITPDDDDEVFLKSTSDVNVIPNMNIGYSAQQKDAVARIGKSSNDLSIVFYDSYKQAIIHIKNFQTVVRSIKNNNIFKRQLDMLAGTYNQKRFGVFAIHNPRTEEVIFVFRPKMQLSKPWLPEYPGVSAIPDNNVLLVEEGNMFFASTYFGDRFEFAPQNDNTILLPTNTDVDELNEYIISEENYIPVFYRPNLGRYSDISVQNQPPTYSNNSLWQPITAPIPFAISLNTRTNGIQNFYRFMPYDIINAELDALIHHPREWTEDYKRPLYVLSSNVADPIIGRIGPIRSKGVIEVIFNAGRPVTLRNIYIQSDIQPSTIRVYSRAGTSTISSFSKKNDQYVCSVPNPTATRSHIDISFKVRIIFPTFGNERPNLSYVIAVVSDEPTGPGSIARL